MNKKCFFTFFFVAGVLSGSLGTVSAESIYNIELEPALPFTRANFEVAWQGQTPELATVDLTSVEVTPLEVAQGRLEVIVTDISGEGSHSNALSACVDSVTTAAVRAFGERDVQTNAVQTTHLEGSVVCSISAEE